MSMWLATVGLVWGWLLLGSVAGIVACGLGRIATESDLLDQRAAARQAAVIF